MTKIVPIHPWPMHPRAQAEVDRFNAAARATGDGTEFLPVEAVPGGPGPVVSMGKTPPPWACDVLQVIGPHGIEAALRVAIGDHTTGVRFTPVADRLAEMFGAEHGEVKQVAGNA